MPDLERKLVALGAEIDWPATPRLDLVLDSEPARPHPRRRPLALAFAVLLVVAAGVLAASPGARSAFLEIFRLKGATVALTETLPEVDAQRLDFGQLVSREEAERRVGFELLLLGGEEPDGIYVRPDRVASAVYGDPKRPRLVLSQLRGSVWGGLVKKMASRETTIEEVDVDGEPGLFLSGGEHFLMFLDENEAVTGEPAYLAGTVLLWNRGPLLLRLEGDLTRDEALELAESVE